MPTNFSLPEFQASWPGGIVYDWPAVMVFSVPSFTLTTRLPDTQ